MNEEQHEELHTRGELIKFAVLVLILLVTILVIAAARPLIFQRILPNVLGWTEAPTEPGAPAPTPENSPVEQTPAPAAKETPSPTGEETSPPAGEETPVVAASPTPAPASAEGATPGVSVTPRVHIVQQGENLTEIAQRYGVAVDALARANNLTNRNRIYPGDQLIIP